MGRSFDCFDMYIINQIKIADFNFDSYIRMRNSNFYNRVWALTRIHQKSISPSYCNFVLNKSLFLRFLAGRYKLDYVPVFDKNLQILPEQQYVLEIKQNKEIEKKSNEELFIYQKYNEPSKYINPRDYKSRDKQPKNIQRNDPAEVIGKIAKLPVQDYNAIKEGFNASTSDKYATDQIKNNPYPISNLRDFCSEIESSDTFKCDSEIKDAKNPPDNDEMCSKYKISGFKHAKLSKKRTKEPYHSTITEDHLRALRIAESYNLDNSTPQIDLKIPDSKLYHQRDDDFGEFGIIKLVKNLKKKTHKKSAQLNNSKKEINLSPDQNDPEKRYLEYQKLKQKSGGIQMDRKFEISTESNPDSGQESMLENVPSAINKLDLGFFDSRSKMCNDYSKHKSIVNKNHKKSYDEVSSNRYKYIDAHLSDSKGIIYDDSDAEDIFPESQMVEFSQNLHYITMCALQDQLDNPEKNVNPINHIYSKSDTNYSSEANYTKYDLNNTRLASRNSENFFTMTKCSKKTPFIDDNQHKSEYISSSIADCINSADNNKSVSSIQKTRSYGEIEAKYSIIDKFSRKRGGIIPISRLSDTDNSLDHSVEYDIVDHDLKNGFAKYGESKDDYKRKVIRSDMRSFDGLLFAPNQTKLEQDIGARKFMKKHFSEHSTSSSDVSAIILDNNGQIKDNESQSEYKNERDKFRMLSFTNNPYNQHEFDIRNINNQKNYHNEFDRRENIPGDIVKHKKQQNESSIFYKTTTPLKKKLHINNAYDLASKKDDFQDNYVADSTLRKFQNFFDKWYMLYRKMKSCVNSENISEDTSSLLESNTDTTSIESSELFCDHCKTFETSLWRRVNGKPVCNACGLYYKMHAKIRPISLKKSTIRKRRRVIKGRTHIN